METFVSASGVKKAFSCLMNGQVWCVSGLLANTFLRQGSLFDFFCCHVVGSKLWASSHPEMSNKTFPKITGSKARMQLAV